MILTRSLLLSTDWAKMTISISVITQNRPASLVRLLSSMASAHYVGDNIPLSFHIDRKVDIQTLRLANNFDWPHGNKLLHRRIIQGGLIRAVSESWYPTSDHTFGLLLEDDVEVSPFFYLWLKYTLLVYHYDPKVIFMLNKRLNSLGIFIYMSCNVNLSLPSVVNMKILYLTRH